MKRTLAFVLAILMLLCLAGCGGSSKESAANDMAPAEPMEAPMPAAAEAEENSYSLGSAATADSSAVNQSQDKIIYSGYAEIETLDFDRSVEAVHALIARHGGFLESSSVRGTDYTGEGRRSADFVIRIPRESFETVTGGLSELGNVSYSRVQAENVSASYYDTESRLAAYRIEEERLLSMLEKAETVEDMLAIEDRLTAVRYEIESHTTTLMNWDSLINYSTLELYLREVVEYTAEPELSYWQKLGRGFVRSLEKVGEFFKDLFRFVVVNLPVLVLVAAAAVALGLGIRHRRRKKAARVWGRAEEKKDE